MSYLTDKFKGVYRLKVPIDKNTNDFPRKPNGQYEDIDMYISCQHGNMICHDTGSTLLAYIPSLQRGHRDNDCWKFPAIAMRDTVIHKNDRICQFEIQKVQPEIEFVEVEHLDDTDRGGIGSTGRA